MALALTTSPPATGVPPNCFVLIKATPTGFMIDNDITKPNSGIFNCDAANVFKLKGLATG